MTCGYASGTLTSGPQRGSLISTLDTGTLQDTGHLLGEGLLPRRYVYTRMDTIYCIVISIYLYIYAMHINVCCCDGSS
jgi:hypothetical protein